MFDGEFLNGKKRNGYIYLKNGDEDKFILVGEYLDGFINKIDNYNDHSTNYNINYDDNDNIIFNFYSDDDDDEIETYQEPI